MLQIPYEDIIAKIKENSDLSDKEINEKIEQKKKELSDLISKEGAAHIVANELGIKLLEKVSGRLQIKNIIAGMRNVELVGKVQQVYEVREFQNEKRSGKVGSFIVADETGTIRVVAWGGQTDKFNDFKEGDIVKIESGYVRMNNDRKEIHLNDKSKLVVNPEGEEVKVSNVKEKQETIRKDIKDLKERDNNVEIFGTVVQAFNPNFFEVCPECGKRAREKEGNFVCSKHDKVEPNFSYVMNCFVDDGTENIRAVFFRDQMEKLLDKKREEILELRENTEKFDELKNDLLGKQIKVQGRVTKNDMFDRLEFISNSVDSSPDPKEEIKRLSKEKEEEPNVDVEEVI